MEMTDTQLVQSVMKMQEELAAALTEMNVIMTEMAGSAKPVFPSDEEERKQVLQFMFNLQASGITNMINSDSYLQKRFGFTKSKAEAYLFDYIDNYSELQAQYTEKPTVSVASSVSSETTKKRKGPKPYSEMTPEELAIAKAKNAKRPVFVEPLTPSPTEATIPTHPISTIKRIVKKKVNDASKPKSNAMAIWNSFMNTVKVEMEKDALGAEVKYDDIRKKAQEMKNADPDSYKLFSDNWTEESV